jgi:hypothetical protein
LNIFLKKIIFSSLFLMVSFTIKHDQMVQDHSRDRKKLTDQMVQDHNRDRKKLTNQMVQDHNRDVIFLPKILRY